MPRPGLLGGALAAMRDVQVLQLVPYVVDSTARLAAGDAADR